MLIVVDAYSKWINAYITTGSTSAITIRKLREAFAEHGIPDVVVSDNATCFIAEEFQDFLLQNGVVHVCSAPHHPSTNGLAECKQLKKGFGR